MPRLLVTPKPKELISDVGWNIAWEMKILLDEPADVPWEYEIFEPIIVGPTWTVNNKGYWNLPDKTLGWTCIAWCADNMQFQGNPWRFSAEQARFILWFYALNEDGEFIFVDASLQRLKGWGKDPLAACLCGFELLGPCQFDYWDDDGQPVSKLQPAPWVQAAAVSLEQTKTTTRLFPALFTDAAKSKYRMQIGKETIYANGDTAMFQAVTSSPETLEGARATFILMNETQHWKTSNRGHDMSEVISRNAAKIGARTLRIFNAFRPGEDSVAERDRSAFELVAAGEYLDIGILYDSLEAPEDAELSQEFAPIVLTALRGDSYWLNVKRMTQTVLDPRIAPSISRRFWYNQILASDDAWISPFEWEGCLVKRELPNRKEAITLGFDGSRSRTRTTDATALIGCSVKDGFLFQPLDKSVWEAPQGAKGWVIPTLEIDTAVEEIFRRYNVVGFFADPAKWESWIARWEARFGPRLKVKSSLQHPIEFWITGGTRLKVVKALASFKEATLNQELFHDGSYHLGRHILNARIRETSVGDEIYKENPESPNKIDAAYAAVLAYTARQQALAAGIGLKVSGGFRPRRIL